MVVDHRMDVVVTDPPFGSGACPSTIGPPAASGWDPAQLLHVDVDELARSLSLIAQRALPAGSDHLARHRVALRKPRHAGAAQHSSHGAFGHPAQEGQLGWAAAVLSAGGQDSALTAGVGAPRRTMRSARTVLESGQTLLVEAPHPAMGALA